MSAQRVAYEELVKELKSLLDSSQKGLDVATLKKDYQSICCGDLHAKVVIFGYPSVEEFLRKLASQGEVRVDYERGFLVFPIADEKTAHLRKLVLRQAPKKKKKTPAPVARTKRSQVVTSKIPQFLKEIVMKLVSEHEGGRGLLMSELPVVLWRSAGVTLDVSALGFKDLQSAMVSLAEETPSLSLEPVCAQPGGISTDFVLTSLHSPSATRQPRIPNKTCVRNAAGNASSVAKAGSAAAAAKAAPPMLSKHVKDSLLRVIENSGPGGLNLDDLPGRYKKCIGRELSVGGLQFNSLAALVSSIPDLALVLNESSGQLRVKSRRLDAAATASQLHKSVGCPMELIDATSEPMTRPAASASAACSSTGSLSTRVSAAAAAKGSVISRPPVGGGDGPAISGTCHVYRLKSHLPQISLESVGRNANVHVTFLKSPSLFYVQLATDAAMSKLESMEKKLRATYNTLGPAGMTLPTASLEIGLLCAAPLGGGRWCRAAVIARQEADDIQVEAIDDGSSACVKVSSLRLLKPEFLDLPPQAIPCCLAGVAPKASSNEAAGDSAWATDATNEFKRMCEKECRADFVGFTRDGRQLVCLRVQHDPSSASCVGIVASTDVAETLIIAGFAVSHKDASWTLTDELALPLIKPNNFSEEVLDESVGDLKIRRVALRSKRHLCFVVTFEGHDYVTSSEVCSYMKFESTALLKLRLKQHPFGGFPHILLSIDQNINLTQCLRRHGLKCYDDDYSGGILYELQSIANLLVAAGCEDLLLIRHFRRYLLDCVKAKAFDARVEAQLPAAVHSLKSPPVPPSAVDVISVTADALQRDLSFKTTASFVQRDHVSSVSPSLAANGGPRTESQNAASGVRMSSASMPIRTQEPLLGNNPQPTFVGRGRGFMMNAVMNVSIGRGRAALQD